MAQGSDGDFELELNGLTMESYETIAILYNRFGGHTVDSLRFFNFCLETWLNLKAVHDQAVQSNMPQLIQVPYRMFCDMVIVGAQSELERLRERWPSASPVDTGTVRYLRGWRDAASSDYGTTPLVADTEEEYYRDGQEDEDIEPEVPEEPYSDGEN